jgi:hypothetical protein
MSKITYKSYAGHVGCNLYEPVRKFRYHEAT